MDEELKKRFLNQKIEDFVCDDIKPFPTVLCEQDDPRITELIRRFCMFAYTMIPFKCKDNMAFVLERLDIQSGSVDFGDLYIWVTVN